MKRGPRGNLLPLKKRKSALWLAARKMNGGYRVRSRDKRKVLMNWMGKRMGPYIAHRMSEKSVTELLKDIEIRTGMSTRGGHITGVSIISTNHTDENFFKKAWEETTRDPKRGQMSHGRILL